MKRILAVTILAVATVAMSGCVVAKKTLPWHPENNFERQVKKAQEGYAECQALHENGTLKGTYDLYNCRAAVLDKRHDHSFYPYDDLVQDYIDVVREQAMQVDCNETTLEDAKAVMKTAHASWKKQELERCLMDTYVQDVHATSWLGAPQKMIQMWEHECRPTSDGKTSLDHVNFR